MKDFVIKQNDTFPAIEVEVKKPNGRPYDLTNVLLAKFILRGSDGITIFNKDAVVIDEENGIIQYIWDAEDTAEAGNFEGEFKLVFTDGNVLTVPNSEYIDVKIVDDI